MKRPQLYYRIFAIDENGTQRNGILFPIRVKNWNPIEHDDFFETQEQAIAFIEEHFKDCNDDPSYTLVIMPVYSVESKNIPQ